MDVDLTKFHIRGCTLTLYILIFLVHTSTLLSNWRQKQICGCRFNKISYSWVHIHFKYFNFSCSHLCTTFKLEKKQFYRCMFNKISCSWVHIHKNFECFLFLLFFHVHVSTPFSNRSDLWVHDRNIFIFMGPHLQNFHICGCT